MNTYLSSGKIDKKEVKQLYKKYNDLPNDIIKQIVQYKLNENSKFDYADAICRIRKFNAEIKRYQKALEIYMDIEKNTENVDKTIHKVFIPWDDGSELGYEVGAEFAVKHLKTLAELKKAYLNEARYRHFMKKYNL